MKSQSRKLFHGVIAIAGVALLSSGATTAFAQQAQSQVMTTTTNADTEQAPKLASGEVDSLVAPIALYSDPLLAQTLAASTYPLEIIQLQQWMDRNKNLKGKALADAVAKQPWDPSVQGLVEFPDVVQRMAGNVQWTTDLGNAFLAQQSDGMDAVQRMRAKAQGTGNLKTSAQQVVKTETVPSGKQVIAIEQANPEVVYVPSYDPTVVYGAAPPAYPYYPYTYPGYVPGTALAWGAGAGAGPGGGGAGARPSGGGAGARPGGGGAAARPGGGSAKNQVGNRSASSRPSSASRGGGGFGGGGSGNYARASSNRGGHSMGGGGMSRGGGGGGRGGGGRGGGGGGRR